MRPALGRDENGRPQDAVRSFWRCAIAEEGMLRDAAMKLAALHDGESAPRVVVPLRAVEAVANSGEEMVDREGIEPRHGDFQGFVSDFVCTLSDL